MDTIQSLKGKLDSASNKLAENPSGDMFRNTTILQEFYDAVVYHTTIGNVSQAEVYLNYTSSAYTSEGFIRGQWQ